MMRIGFRSAAIGLERSAAILTNTSVQNTQFKVSGLSIEAEIISVNNLPALLISSDNDYGHKKLFCSGGYSHLQLS